MPVILKELLKSINLLLSSYFLSIQITQMSPHSKAGSVPSLRSSTAHTSSWHLDAVIFGFADLR